MKRPSFNVLDEPWIPVVHSNGSSEELGILPCLEQAHTLREIRDPSPIIEFGLYRLLVAFLLDALILADQRPEDPLDLETLIAVGRFDMSHIGQYVEECGDVFDLFHAKRPFLQTLIQDEKVKPLAGLYPVAPSGTNVRHWHHKDERDLELTDRESARVLSTIAPFMTAGGAGLSPSINGAPAIYALPVGENLFETLVVNLPLRNQDSGHRTVAWRENRSPGEERTSATTVEALTWRPRRVQLIPTTKYGGGLDVRVRKMKFGKGDSTRLLWIDTNLAYRHDKDKSYPIRMRENHPLWRDAGPLFLLNEIDCGKAERKVAFRRPDVIEQALALAKRRSPIHIQAYGMRTDMKMKVFEWTKSVLCVPTKLARSTRLGSLVHQELDRAEQAANGLRNCIRSLYPRQGAGNKKALGSIIGRCEKTYWQHLEASFQPLMNAFAVLDEDAPDDPDLVASTAKPWREAIHSLAVQQFELAAKDMDADSDALERQVQARRQLNNKLRRVLS